MKIYYTLITLVILLASNTYAQAEMATKNEINVQGESWLAVAPDTAIIGVVFEENGSVPTAIAKSLDDKIQNLFRALNTKDKTITLRSRGRSFEGADGAGMPVTTNAVIHAIEHITINASSVSLTPLIIEEALKAGASGIINTRYKVKNDSAARLEAIKEATSKAREKALYTAQTLGVKLGKLNSITVGEEEGAALLIQQRMLGENPTQYGDKEIKIIVAARFEIEDDIGQ